jgi:type IV secretory pathway VirB9-like protein
MKTASLTTLLLLASAALFAQQTARVVKYHTHDIVPVRAKMRYTTLIQLPAAEKILEAATGDKDFWIIEAVGSYCFLHPAKEGIHSNLNLITDKGSIYSFTLDEAGSELPDLKLVVEPSDPSALAVIHGPPKFVSVAELDAARTEVQLAQGQVKSAVEQFRTEYPTKTLKFDYTFGKDKPFQVAAIFRDDQFTYIKSSAAEKFAIYEVKDGKPDLINFQLTDGTYVIPKVVDHGYLEIGKHRVPFDRQQH